MTRKTHQSSIDPSADLRTDYALMAACAIGAALFALIYLILI
jgi:hypothetical protein